MRVRKSAAWVLVYECIGFGLLILLAWYDELEGIAQALFGGQPHVHDWRDSALQTLVIFYVWAIVFGLTKKLVNHLYYLDGFVRMCAWCRRVGYKNEWIRVEQYFSQGFRIETTHGMCPECLKKVQEETAQYVRQEGQGLKEADKRQPGAAHTPATPGRVPVI